jgi:hypothetical protein
MSTANSQPAKRVFVPAKKTLLVFGIGKLGGPVVDTLAVRFPDHLFVLVSRDRVRSQRRANLSRYLAAQWGLYPECVGEEADLFDPARTAELIHRWNPDVVFNATTPFPWWKIDSLPEREKDLSHRAGPGMWCALDCLLPMLLTEALSLANSRAMHVNGCYPDMTNTFLSEHQCAPRLGIGNISNLVPGLQLGYAYELGLSPSEVEIQIVGHHYISWNAPSDRGCPNAPYYLAVTHPGGQLSFRGPSDAPFGVLRRRVSRVRGLDGLGVTITSAATLLAQLLGSTPRRHHSPGANGLPGGYPVRIGTCGEVTLDLPADLSEEQATEINRLAQVFDGILHVEAGKVIPTPLAQEAYSEVVGANLPEVTPSNVVELSLSAMESLDLRFNLGLQNA